LIGWSRIYYYRVMLAVDLPEDLFEPLLKTKCSLRQIAKIVEMFRDRHRAEVEFCPHCGGPQRIRASISKRAIEIVNEWRARGGKLKSEIELDAVAVAEEER
jgi:hypothetical protein